MKIIGITGGVGAGKTQILEYLSDKYGASVCQTDKVAKKLQKKGGICYDPIVEHFGTEILDEKGELDRKKLSDIVFGDPKELNVLNEIVHEHKAAVRREIVQKRDERRALLLGELEEVTVRHDDERTLGHHRHRLDRFVQLLHCQRLAAQAVVVELLKARGDELFFDLAEVVFAQIALLAVKDVDLTDIARAQVAFQFLIALVGRFSLCHEVLSVHCDQYIALHVRAVDRHARVRQAQQRLLGRMAVAVVAHADNADLRRHRFEQRRTGGILRAVMPDEQHLDIR